MALPVGTVARKDHVVAAVAAAVEGLPVRDVVFGAVHTGTDPSGCTAGALGPVPDGDGPGCRRRASPASCGRDVGCGVPF